MEGFINPLPFQLREAKKGENIMYSLSKEDEARLGKDFIYHPPKGDQTKRYGEIRNAGSTMAQLLLADCPRSRELSLALTKIEEAVFWANAAIARNE